MKKEERQRADAFIDRLKAPIGSLEEDRVAEGGAVFSPFGIVGVSVFFIGLMLLAVIPWVGPGLAVWLTAGFGVLMLVIGALMFLYGRNRAASG